MSRFDPQDMWAHVDSTQSPYAYMQRKRGWAAQRDERCIALRSDGDRCYRLAAEGAGFCGFHFERLLTWLIAGAAEPVVAAAQREDPSAFRYVIDNARLDDAMRVLEDAEAQVYFIAVDDIVKIGYSRNVRARFASIRQGSKLLVPEGYSVKGAVLLGAIPGGVSVESRLHGLLSNYRLSGEWFRLSTTVISTIDHLLYGAEPPRAIEAGLRDMFSAEPGQRRRNRRAVA